MNLYLVNLIESPELKDCTLEEILVGASDKIIEIPDSAIPYTIGRSIYADMTIDRPDLTKGYIQKFKEYAHDILRKLRGKKKRIHMQHRIEDQIWQSVSKNHCLLHNDGSNVYVEDLRSKNGTFVNRISVDTSGGVLINDGDRLCLGPFVLKVLFEPKYKGLKNRSESPLEDDNETSYNKSDGFLPPTVEYNTEEGDKKQ